MTAACHLRRWIETYLDGELSPEHTIDFEEHLRDCCSCQARVKFERALRFSLRQTVRGTSYPSEAFQVRLRAIVAKEAQSQEQTTIVPRTREPAAVSTPNQSRPLTWRAITPLSVAAAAALVFAALRNEPTDPMTSPLPAGVSGSSVTSKDVKQTVRDFLDQLAADTEHNVDDNAGSVEEADPVFLSPRPPPVINVSNGRHWPLPKLEHLGGVLEGFRYRNVARESRVPSVLYRIGGHRVLLWAYDSERVPLRVLLDSTVARDRAVFVGTHRGTTVAAVEHGSHGLVATTDLSPSEAAEVVTTAFVQ
jgi:hypothetical protein